MKPSYFRAIPRTRRTLVRPTRTEADRSRGSPGAPVSYRCRPGKRSRSLHRRRIELTGFDQDIVQGEWADGEEMIVFEAVGGIGVKSLWTVPRTGGAPSRFHTFSSDQVHSGIGVSPDAGGPRTSTGPWMATTSSSVCRSAEETSSSLRSTRRTRRNRPADLWVTESPLRCSPTTRTSGAWSGSRQK